MFLKATAVKHVSKAKSYGFFSYREDNFKAFVQCGIAVLDKSFLFIYMFKFVVPCGRTTKRVVLSTLQLCLWANLVKGAGKAARVRCATFRAGGTGNETSVGVVMEAGAVRLKWYSFISSFSWVKFLQLWTLGLVYGRLNRLSTLLNPLCIPTHAIAATSA